MNSILCALALAGGVIGAGFASGGELLRFFAVHGPAFPAAVLFAVLTAHALFLCLPARMAGAGCDSLPALCRLRFGARLGALCGWLFFALSAVTGGAMLAACAELAALTLPLRHAYGAGMAVSLLLGAGLSARGLRGTALPGALLLAVLPALLLRLLLLPSGEARFLPAAGAGAPFRAALSGAVYAALTAAQLAGMLPQLLALGRRERRRAVRLFSLLFLALLLPGVLVCLRHLAAVRLQPLPFLWLSRSLPGGHLLVAACLYAAALSTLCAMLAGMRRVPLSLAAGFCLLLARLGFSDLVARAYPVLGALCAGLLLLLCLPYQAPSPSSR